MSPAERDAGWTVATLKTYVDQRLTDIDKAVQAALAAAEKAVGAALAAAQRAVEAAEANAKAWREGANEWRGAMNDRERSFATVKDMEVLKQRLDEVRTMVEAVRTSINEVGNLARGVRGQKDDQRVWLAAFVGVALLLIALWRVFAER